MYLENEAGDTLVYWRKANQIHNWFVKFYCNDDHDFNMVAKADRPFVDRQGIASLIEACETAITERDLAPNVLPTRSGFFFGGTEYDEWYYDELKRTKKELSALMTDPSFDGGYYNCWW